MGSVRKRKFFLREEIGVGFVGNVLGNVGRIFGEKEVVIDGEYRIQVMKMFECI